MGPGLPSYILLANLHWGADSERNARNARILQKRDRKMESPWTSNLHSLDSDKYFWGTTFIYVQWFVTGPGQKLMIFSQDLGIFGSQVSEKAVLEVGKMRRNLGFGRWSTNIGTCWKFEISHETLIIFLVIHI